MKVLIETDISTFLNVKLLTTCVGVVFLVAWSRFRLGGFLKVRRILEVTLRNLCLPDHLGALFARISGRRFGRLSRPAAPAAPAAGSGGLVV